MRNKKLKICATLMAVLFVLAGTGCDDDPTPPPPALDWNKIASYDPGAGDTVLGNATAELDGTNGRYQETVLGNFIMDGIAEYARYASGANVDFALHNGQNLKVFSLPAGDITNADILALIGTDKLFVCTYTGAQVKTIIEGFVNSDTAGSWKANCAVMVSKEVKYDIVAGEEGEQPTAQNIKINGAVINDTQEYKVAVGNFIGDNTNATRFFPVLDEAKKTDYTTPLNQAVALYVLAKGAIKPADYPLGRYLGVVPPIIE